VVATLAGCISTATNIEVVINDLPATPVLSSNSPLCYGGTLNISSNAPNGVSYNWSGPNSFSSSAQSVNITNATADLSGNYNLFVTNLNTGCISAAASISVLVNAVPDVPDMSATTQLCYGDTLTLYTTTIASTYAWSGPNGFLSDLQNPVITGVSDAIIGVYTLRVTNISGCISEDTINIVMECEDITDIFVPNVFTPNGDGENQTFKVITANLKTVEVEIYDRWGILLYTWNNLEGSWDGKNRNGSECSAGTYYYIVNATTYVGKNISKKGSFSLFR
jgi:gliding motility-associated-like protein